MRNISSLFYAIRVLIENKTFAVLSVRLRNTLMELIQRTMRPCAL